MHRKLFGLKFDTKDGHSAMYLYKYHLMEKEVSYEAVKNDSYLQLMYFEVCQNASFIPPLVTSE